MRFFISQMATETNTFAPAPTGWLSFEQAGLHHGDGSLKDPQSVVCSTLAELRRLAEADGHQVVESLAAFAQPGGCTLKNVYEAMRDEILSDLEKALPLDGVLLVLHGAMVAIDYDDCEGDLISRVRALVGPDVPIGVELDLHCHTTPLMLQSADIIIAYKEYPHIDAALRAGELYRLTRDTALGLIRPTTAIHDCRMVGLWHTTREPMKSFVADMQALEGKDGVLSVSFGHGFPWGDTVDSGARVWVVTDNDPAGAARLAEQLGRRIWDEREATRAPGLSIDEALDQALAFPGGPVVLADVADNPGGGAAGDATFVLRRLIERGIGDAVTGLYWDPGAILQCRDAGVGACFDLRLGGKSGPSSGDPVDLRVTVRAILDGHSQRGLGARWPLGVAVWLEAAGGLDIVLASVRSQVFHPEAFAELGIDLAAKKLIIVKSTQHFHAGFAPIAAEILYIAAPGSVSPDFVNLPYVKRSLNYWPRVDDPFAA